jgi:hypothetical protein
MVRTICHDVPVVWICHPGHPDEKEEEKENNEEMVRESGF